MIRFKAAVFDLDGVLCHTDQYHYQAWKTVADKLGIYFDEKINDRLRGVSRMQSLDIILERCARQLDEGEKLNLADEKNRIYQERLKAMSPSDLEPEIMRTLEALRGAGLMLAVASSSRNAKLILNRLGLGDYFDAVADGSCITHSKPHPEVFETAAAMLGCHAAACFAVEDARAGIQAARGAGMFAVAYGGDAAGCGLENMDITSFSQLLTLIMPA